MSDEIENQAGGPTHKVLIAGAAYAILAGLVCGLVCGLVAGGVSGWVTIETERVINAGATHRAALAHTQRIDLQAQTNAGLTEIRGQLTSAPLCKTR